MTVRKRGEGGVRWSEQSFQKVKEPRTALAVKRNTDGVKASGYLRNLTTIWLGLRSKLRGLNIYQFTSLVPERDTIEFLEPGSTRRGFFGIEMPHRFVSEAYAHSHLPRLTTFRRFILKNPPRFLPQSVRTWENTVSDTKYIWSFSALKTKPR